jgi:hypothetical protein
VDLTNMISRILIQKLARGFDGRSFEMDIWSGISGPSLGLVGGA